MKKSMHSAMTCGAGKRELPNEPIGMLSDGMLNIVKLDDPPFVPIVIDDLGRPVSGPSGKDRVTVNN